MKNKCEFSVLATDFRSEIEKTKDKYDEIHIEITKENVMTFSTNGIIRAVSPIFNYKNKREGMLSWMLWATVAIDLIGIFFDYY